VTRVSLEEHLHLFSRLYGKFTISSLRCILLSLVWLIKFFFFLFVFKVLLTGNLVAGIRRESGWQRCEKGKKG
jgi:hypothetical protein